LNVKTEYGVSVKLKFILSFVIFKVFSISISISVEKINISVSIFCKFSKHKNKTFVNRIALGWATLLGSRATFAEMPWQLQKHQAFLEMP